MRVFAHGFGRFARGGGLFGVRAKDGKTGGGSGDAYPDDVECPKPV